MKATELKNGNLIIGTYESEDDNLIHESICEFKFYDCYSNYYYVESKDGIEDFTGFKPIKLSEEILLKCPQIEKSDDYGDQKYFNLIGTSYWFCLDHDDFSFGIYNKKDNQSDVTILQYWDLGINLHQLQNLIYALTNEELKVNL